MPASLSTVSGWGSCSVVSSARSLGVDVSERRQLRQHQRVVALAEAMQVEDEASEVAIGELACLAQEADPAANPPPRDEAGALLRPGG